MEYEVVWKTIHGQWVPVKVYPGPAPVEAIYRPFRWLEGLRPTRPQPSGASERAYRRALGLTSPSRLYYRQCLECGASFEVGGTGAYLCSSACRETRKDRRQKARGAAIERRKTYVHNS